MSFVVSKSGVVCYAVLLLHKLISTYLPTLCGYCFSQTDGFQYTFSKALECEDREGVSVAEAKRN